MEVLRGKLNKRKLEQRRKMRRVGERWREIRQEEGEMKEAEKIEK